MKLLIMGISSGCKTAKDGLIKKVFAQIDEERKYTKRLKTQLTEFNPTKILKHWMTQRKQSAETFEEEAKKVKEQRLSPP